MLQYENVAAFVSDVLSAKQFSGYSMVFVDIAAWNAGPLTAPLFLFSFEEAEEFNPETGLPAVAVAHGLKLLLMTSNIEDVIHDLHAKNPSASPVEYARAIDHYREFDSFL